MFKAKMIFCSQSTVKEFTILNFARTLTNKALQSVLNVSNYIVLTCR